MNNEVKIEISKKIFNDVYLPYLDNRDRILIFYGGGSSGKSYSIAQRIVYNTLKRKMNLLVVRKTARTNRDSTFALIKQIISKWKLSKIYKINESDLRIRNIVNGNEIVFAGLDDVEKLKSITFENGELTDIWIEEATEILESDFNQLMIRLRGGKSKKQIVLSFNPVDINHWIKKKLIDTKKATFIKTTYKDNKFLIEEDSQVLESFKDTDPYYYDVYCKGNWGVLGKTYFDAKQINKRLNEIKEPIKVGFFSYEYDDTKPRGEKISKIKWVDDENGYIKIYKELDKHTPYIIGGDTAGDGSDFFTAHVNNNITGEQIAVLKQEFDEDIYSKQMYCLGKYYNNALIGIEANFSTFPIKELERLGYDKQFIREREDTYTGKTSKAFGTKTTAITRPVMLSNLVEIVREHIELINDRETLEEMLTFVRNEKGRPEAQEGTHDDLVMGLAITYYIRGQQTMKNINIELENEFIPSFNVLKPKPNSANPIGTEIKII